MTSHTTSEAFAIVMIPLVACISLIGMGGPCWPESLRADAAAPADEEALVAASPDTPVDDADGPSATPAEAVRNIEFWAIFFVIFAECGAGLAIINNIGQLVSVCLYVCVRVILFMCVSVRV
jgi:hypothetical protein